MKQRQAEQEELKCEWCVKDARDRGRAGGGSTGMEGININHGICRWYETRELLPMQSTDL